MPLTVSIQHGDQNSKPLQNILYILDFCTLKESVITAVYIEFVASKKYEKLFHHYIFRSSI